MIYLTKTENQINSTQTFFSKIVKLLLINLLNEESSVVVSLINKCKSEAACAAQTPEGIMKVKVISILEDNYMYLVIEEQSKQAVAVDPAVPHRVRFPLCF